jgi:RimJ/RimL family protein N-acetyltransferase
MANIIHATVLAGVTICDGAVVARITANVFQPNLASQRILLKNGFIREGVLRKAVIKEGIIYDLLLYGLLK